MRYLFIYLASVVAANLTITYLGPGASIVTAFLCIGASLTSRDGLHELWNHQGLVWKMVALIGAGSLLSWVLNRDAGPIAIASFVSFIASGALDTVAYALLYKREWMVKVNGSNIIGAAADSVLFPTLAFGAFMPWIVIGQFAAKVGGGFIWSLLLSRIRRLAVRR